jgi:hypothetical protein
VVYLRDQAWTQGLSAVLIGIAQPRLINGATGATLLIQAGQASWSDAALNRRVEIRPNQRYRLRVLRQPRQETIFLDGVEVLRAPVPDFELPRLTIQGSWGKPGDRIYFTNIELRAPREAIDERDARSLVGRLFDKLLLRGAVQERIRADASLSEPVRKLALQAAESHAEDAGRLHEASWKVVQTQVKDGEAARRALAQAEAANRLEPGNRTYLGTLGAAQYRGGRSRCRARRPEAWNRDSLPSWRWRNRGSGAPRKLAGRWTSSGTTWPSTASPA